METCKGFADWLECLNCPRLCTKACPIEGENVMEEMRRQIHMSFVSDVKKESRYFE